MDVCLYIAAVVEGSINENAFLIGCCFEVFSETGGYSFYYYKEEDDSSNDNGLQGLVHNPTSQGE